VAAWINAERDGRCSNCAQRIKTGEEIYMKGKSALCEECGMLAVNTREACGPIESSVRSQIEKLPDEANDNPLSQMMLFLASQLDMGEVSTRDVANLTKELRMNMITLTEMFPAEEDDDETETLRKRRERRARESGGF